MAHIQYGANDTIIKHDSVLSLPMTAKEARFFLPYMIVAI